MVSVDPITDETVDLFGKKCTDLQKYVSVGDRGIAGKLFKVDDYTGFSPNPEEQSGSYLCLKVESEQGAVIEVGITKMTTLDEDGMIVLRVTETTKNLPVKVKATKDGRETIREFNMDSVILGTDDDPTCETATNEEIEAMIRELEGL